MREIPGDFQIDFNHARPPHSCRLEEKIDKGGQATVYLGYELEHPSETVAVKVFNPVAAEMAELQSEEAQRISALDHPNIIKAHWHGTHVHGSGQRRVWRRSNFDPDISHYVVTEYADGGTLKHRAETDPHPEKIVAAIAQVISATAYAHGEGRPSDAIRLVHRDIKPTNVLFSAKEEALLPEGFPVLATFGNGKLSDFGVAIYGPGRTVDNEEYTVTTTQIATGTLPYMPPEQFLGKAVPASDDYAIGVMAYRSMTGQLPINAKSSLQDDAVQIALWFKAHENNPVAAFADVAPLRMNKLYEAIEPVVVRLLEKQPEDRYPSTGELLEAYRVATVTGMDAMKRDAVYIDLGASSGSAGRASGETPQSGALYDAISTTEKPDADGATEAISPPGSDGTITATTTQSGGEAALDPTKKLPEPKLFSRRRLLGGASVLGVLVALEMVNALNPSTPETAQSPETRTDEQIVTDAAKEMLAAMEANGMKSDRTAMVIKQLGYSDPDFAWKKIIELQKASDPSDLTAAWLAADFTRHSLSKPAALMNAYKAQGNYDAMAIIAASVAGGTVGSHDSSLSETQRSVDDVISFCEEKPGLQPHLKIVSAAYQPKLPLKLHAFDRIFTTARAVFNDLEEAELYWGVNALGRGLASNDPETVKEIVVHYDQRVQAEAYKEADLYNLLGDLTVALAPYSAPGGGQELTNMGSRSTGIAVERAQQVAIEIARDSTDAVLRYIDSHDAGSNGSRLAAAALTGLAPDKIQTLLTTAPEPAKSWINASLNIRDGHTLNDAIKALIADKNALQNYGPEMAAALLISRRVG